MLITLLAQEGPQGKEAELWGRRPAAVTLQRGPQPTHPALHSEKHSPDGCWSLSIWISLNILISTLLFSYQFPPLWRSPNTCKWHCFLQYGSDFAPLTSFCPLFSTVLIDSLYTTSAYFCRQRVHMQAHYFFMLLTTSSFCLWPCLRGWGITLTTISSKWNCSHTYTPMHYFIQNSVLLLPETSRHEQCKDPSMRQAVGSIQKLNIQL